MKHFLGMLVVGMSIASATWAETPRVITTTGQGIVEEVPDMATISVGVVHEAEQAGDALRLTSQAVREVIARLEDVGIAPRDMQTEGLSLEPIWTRENSTSDTARRITGFMARNALNVRVRVLDDLGEILDMVVQDGANSFDGLQFSVQEPEPAIAAARADAVADAMEKARQLAQAAGVVLGPVQSISEIGGGGRPMMMGAVTARMENDVPVAAGEISLSAQVSMVFSILD